jgi:hypothetical protein
MPRHSLSTLARVAAGRSGLGQVVGHQQGVEAGLVDRVERRLVDVGPGFQIPAGLVQIGAIAGQPPGQGQVQHDRLVLLGLQADLANALARQGAFGVDIWPICRVVKKLV